MFSLVKEALRTIELFDVYFQEFEVNQMDDDAVRACLGEFGDEEILAEVIADSDHLKHFVTAFRNLSPSDSHVKDKVDLAPIAVPRKSASTSEEHLQNAVAKPVPKIRQNTQAEVNIEPSVNHDAKQGRIKPEDPIPALQKSLDQLTINENQAHDDTQVSIGIDLGTTFSCVGLYRKGTVEIIKESESYTIPSCTFFEQDGTITVGKSAQDGAFRSPENFIYDAKRLIGREYSDFTVQDDMKNWHFLVVNDNGQPKIQCREGDYRPEEISAKVLAYLKQLAERHLGQQVKNAVVTVPAYFNEGQRQATKDAAEMAGLSASILTEPVAAAIAYGFHQGDNSKKNVLVFDLGGGTFDVAILSIDNCKINVLTINGDTHLGGEDFDKAIVKHIAEKFRKNTSQDLFNAKQSPGGEGKKQSNNILRRLKFECERKKRDLSYSNVAYIRLEDIGLDESISKKELEEIIFPHLAKCILIVDQALKEAQLRKSDIDEVILVGGSTKIPKVRELLEQYFRGITLKHTVDEDQAVAKGAAIFAALKNGSAGQHTKFVVNDVTPLSIGIKDADGNFVVQDPKNSPLPFSKKGVWTNIVEGQRECVFEIYEGEDSLAERNHFLGKFVLHIPPSKGTVRIQSHTEVSAEGILTVRAICLADSKMAEVKIDALKGRMSQTEIQAKKNADSLRWK